MVAVKNGALSSLNQSPSRNYTIPADASRSAIPDR
jgi:hypothetical protein